MSQATRPSQISERIFTILDAKRDDYGLDPVQGLYFGDQERLPVTPAVCVEPGTTTRALAGAQLYAEMSHECYILVYHSRVQDIQTTLRETVLFGEAIEDVIHKDHLQLQNVLGEDPIVIHGHCVSIDPGYTIKAKQLFRAVRITWQGLSKARIVPSP